MSPAAGGGGADQSEPLNGRCLYQQASDWPKVNNLCASCHLLLGEWKIIYHCVHILFFNIWILDALDMVNMCHQGGGPMQGIALMFWNFYGQSGAFKLMSRSGLVWMTQVGSEEVRNSRQTSRQEHGRNIREFSDVDSIVILSHVYLSLTLMQVKLVTNKCSWRNSLESI